MFELLLNSRVFYGVFAHGETILLLLLLLFTGWVWLRAPTFGRRRLLVICIAAAGIIRIAFSLLTTYVQHYTWARSELGSLFLPPHAPWSYFLGYVGLHFWLATALAFVVGACTYLFLRSLHKYRERFFEGGEAELGCALAMIVGWPVFVLFLVGTCVGIVIVSVVRQTLFARAYTTLGLPMLIGAVLALLLSPWLIDVVGLALWRA